MLATAVARISFVLYACMGVPAGAVSPPPRQAENGKVVTSQHLASDVGVEILKAGGNAVDAAVAVGYALAVVLPCCGNIWQTRSVRSRRRGRTPFIRAR
jgi:gamma-glutamyltranspeptidase/glutathione hydrolase